MLDKLSYDARFEAVRYLSELISTYLAKATALDHSPSKAEYSEVNQLSMQLAMLLPDDLYRFISFAVAGPDESVNRLSATIQGRKYLLGEISAGTLNQNDLVVHAPDAAKKQKAAEAQQLGRNGRPDK